MCKPFQADGVGRMCSARASDKWWVWKRREERAKRSQIRSTIWGFVKKNVRWSQYKPRGGWFSFAKERKLCFLCSCKQYETSISRRCILYAYFLHHPPGTASTYDSQRDYSEINFFIMFYIWIFFLQKCIDLPQDACIHPLEPCFIMDGCTFGLLFLLLFIWLLLNC